MKKIVLGFFILVITTFLGAPLLLYLNAKPEAALAIAAIILVCIMSGEVKSEGGTSDRVAQARLADHAQVIEHKLAEGTMAAQTKPQPLMLDGLRRVTKSASLPADTVQSLPRPLPQIMVLASDDPKARPWVEDAVRVVLSEGDIVDAQARDVIDEYE